MKKFFFSGMLSLLSSCIFVNPAAAAIMTVLQVDELEDMTVIQVKKEAGACSFTIKTLATSNPSLYSWFVETPQVAQSSRIALKNTRQPNETLSRINRKDASIFSYDTQKGMKDGLLLYKAYPIKYEASSSMPGKAATETVTLNCERYRRTDRSL
jgi:hypothetical protein